MQFTKIVLFLTIPTNLGMTFETLRMIPRICATARREPFIIAITQVESHLILAMSNETIPAPKDPFQIFRHTDQYKIKSSQDFEGWFIYVYFTPFIYPPCIVIYIPMYIYIYLYIFIYPAFLRFTGLHQGFDMF